MHHKWRLAQSLSAAYYLSQKKTIIMEFPDIHGSCSSQVIERESERTHELHKV